MEYKLSKQPVDYPDALAEMEARVDAIVAGDKPELLWFLEHPPLYTSGTSAKAGDLLDRRFPAYPAGRGGEWTYHGPGQRVVYAMLDLKKRNAMDMRAYVKNLERWIIATLGQFGVKGFTREGRIGVWVNQESGIRNQASRKNPIPDTRYPIPDLREAKIAALGARVRKWVTFHGIAVNVNPDLSHYAGIVPCGISEYGVTSLEKLGVDVPVADVDDALKKEFQNIF